MTLRLTFSQFLIEKSCFFRLGTYFDYTAVVLRDDRFCFVGLNGLIFSNLSYKPAFLYMQAKSLSD